MNFCFNCVYNGGMMPKFFVYELKKLFLSLIVLSFLEINVEGTELDVYTKCYRRHYISKKISEYVRDSFLHENEEGYLEKTDYETFVSEKFSMELIEKIIKIFDDFDDSDELYEPIEGYYAFILNIFHEYSFSIFYGQPILSTYILFVKLLRSKIFKEEK